MNRYGLLGIPGVDPWIPWGDRWDLGTDGTWASRTPDTSSEDTSSELFIDTWPGPARPGQRRLNHVTEKSEISRQGDHNLGSNLSRTQADDLDEVEKVANIANKARGLPQVDGAFAWPLPPGCIFSRPSMSRESS